MYINFNYINYINFLTILFIMSQLNNISWYKLINTKDLVLGKCKIQSKGYLFKHKHKIPEYYYILSGDGFMRLGNSYQLLVKDNFIKIPKNTYHFTINPFNSDLEFLYIFTKGPFNKIKYYS